MEKDRKRKATDEAKASSKYAKTNDDSLQARSRGVTKHDMTMAQGCVRWRVVSPNPTSKV